MKDPSVCHYQVIISVFLKLEGGVFPQRGENSEVRQLLCQLQGPENKARSYQRRLLTRSSFQSA